MIGVSRTPHGVAFYHPVRWGRLWTFFVVWPPRWWRIGRTHTLWTRAIALGPVAVALTDLTWEAAPVDLAGGDQ